MDGTTEEPPRLLVTRLAEASGVAAVADSRGYRDRAVYLYFASIVFLNWGVLAVVQLLTRGYHPATAYPLWFVPAVAGLGGLWAVRWLADEYRTRRAELGAVVDDPGQLPSTIVPWRLQLAAYGLLVGALIVWLHQPGVLERIGSVQGPLGLPRHAVVYLLLRLPIVAEAVAVVLGIHVLLPWRLTRAGLDLDFADPTRLGGLGTVARLLRGSTQVYFLGLFAITAYAIAPRLFPDQPGVPVHALVSVGVAGAWLAGVGLFVAPTWWLHAEIKRQKYRRCAELRDQLARCGTTPDPFPDHPDVVAGEADELLAYLYLDRVLRRVELTREYPTNAALLRDIGVSSLPSLVMALLTFFGASV